MNHISAILATVLVTVLAISPGLLIMVSPYDTEHASMTETVVIEPVIEPETVELPEFVETVESTEPIETDIPIDTVEEVTMTNSMSSANFETSFETEPIVEETEPETEIATEPIIVETEPIIEVQTKPVIETQTELIAGRIDPSLKVDKNDELALLSAICYQEVGGDYACDNCRRRVIDVVLNRVASPYFPNTIYEVLTQGKLQYGFDSTTGVYWQERCKNPGEAHAVERAYRIAEEVLNGKHSDIYGKDYIWQAEFIQGVNNIYCCNTYFGQRDVNKEW